MSVTKKKDLFAESEVFLAHEDSVDLVMAEQAWVVNERNKLNLIISKE